MIRLTHSRGLSLMVLCVSLGVATQSLAAKKKPETLKSLSGRTPEVRIAEPEPVDSAEKLAAYKQYLADDTADTLLRAEAMRRQADLYMEVAEERSLRSNTDLRTDPDQLEAIRIYNQIRKEYPKYDKLELVFYQLSKAYENVGDQSQVLATLDELVERWPDTQYLGEAQFRRGEILFIRQEYNAAEQAYSAVLELGDGTRFYTQALYKHGWSCFKQGFYPPGIESFLSLLDIKLGNYSEAELPAAIEALPTADRELFDDTMRVMSIAFSYEEGADSVRAYLEQHQNPEYGYLLYQSLADLYLDKERYSDAAGVFEAFAAYYPAHRAAPMFQTQAISAYRDGGFPSLVLESKKSYVATYGLTAGYWETWSPAERPEVIADLKANLSDLAQYHHALGQENADVVEYAAAAEWYRLYLDYFPTDPAAGERSFLLGEVLMASGQPGRAIDAYQAAAYNYAGFPQAAEAGFAAILAARAYRETLQPEQQAEWDQAQIADDLQFANSYPDHPEANPVLVTVAEELFDRDRYTAASIVAGELLTRQPAASEDLQLVSWRVVALSRFDQGAYEHAEDAYLQLATYDIDEAERAEVDERIAAAVFRQAETAQVAGNVDLAVQNYLRVADSSAIKPTAVFDAATLLIVNERWSDSIPVLQQFRSSYPDSALNSDVSQKLAYSYLQAGMLLAAAGEFEALALNGELSDDLRRESLWQAAELYQDKADWLAAQRSYRQFVTDFPTPMSESLEARFRLSNIALELNDVIERDAVLREIVAQDAAAGSSRTERSKYLAATASLELAQPYYDRFAAAKLTAPLQPSMKTKKARMEEALEVYNKAADYGVAEVTTVATYQVAQIYYQLSKDLMASEKPAGLSDDELEQYDILLEEQAFPFEEKAIEIYEVNVARAAGGLYDQAVRDSYARLAELMPGIYARSERTESYVSLTAQ